MKILFAVIMMAFVSFDIMASGTIVAGSGYAIKQNEIVPVIGLAIKEKMPWKLSFNSWQGIGELSRPVVGATYLTSSNMIEYTIGDVVISIGVQVDYFPKTKDLNPLAKIMLSYQLW